MGMFEEPNMGLPSLGSWYLVNYSFWVIQNYRWLEGKKWDPERMKAAIEAMRNLEMGSYKASILLNLPQTLQRYVKDQQKSSSEAIKQNWVGCKLFFVK